jgi:hypothetical protein
MTHTKAIHLRALWGLRVHGPISVNDLADRTGLDPQSLRIAVAKLQRVGLVAQLGPASFDITGDGRAFLECLSVAAAPADNQVEAQPAVVRQLRLFD